MGINQQPNQIFFTLDLGFNGDLTKKKWGFHGNILWDVLGNTAGKDFMIGLTNQDESKNMEYHCYIWDNI